MYPSQTSLIPLSVTFAQFVYTHGLSAFSMWFDLWYLGVPFRYITSPFVPVVMALTHRLLPYFTFYHIAIYFVIVSFVVSLLGWFWFVLSIGDRKKASFVLLWVMILLPWRAFSALALSDVATIFSQALLPYALVFYWWSFIGTKKAHLILTTLFTSFLFFVSITILPQLLVGIGALLAAYMSLISKKSNEYDEDEDRAGHPVYQNTISKNIGKVVASVFVSLCIATLWYGAHFWLTVLANPSIGGNVPAKVFTQLVSFGRSSIPFFSALISVFFIKKITKPLQSFTLVWFGTFALLTIFRFLLDYDFWTDWTSWFGELEIGIALIVASFMTRTKKSFFAIPKPVISVLIIIPWATVLFVYSKLGSPVLISKNVPDSVSGIYILENAVGNEKRAFVSGSTTFWLDSMTSISQVRGGTDFVSVHPYWDHASYQIREGSDAELSQAWLEALGVSYALVHSTESSEYYKDFTYLGKWNENTLIHEESGDYVYKIGDRNIAYLVRDFDFRNLTEPENGADLDALIAYNTTRTRGLEVDKKNNVYEISVPSLFGEAVLLLVSYHPNWSAFDTHGEELEIEQDVLGHMIVRPKSEGIISFVYNK